MSRIAKQPIEIPSGIDLKIENGSITAKGPKGELQQGIPADIELKQEKNLLRVYVDEKKLANKRIRALAGTTRALVNNLVSGVSEGFERKLTIKGIGYRAQAQGNKLNLSLGFSHPIVYQLPEGISVQTPSQTEIVLTGADKQKLGQAAAEIRRFRPPEPYEGKGVRYEGEYIMRKQAKKK